MNPSLGPFLAAIFAVAFLAACSKQASSPIDPGPLERSFTNVEKPLQDAAHVAADAIRKGDYNAALAALQKLLNDARLTEEQNRTVRQLVEQLQKALADTGHRAVGEAQKSLGDLQKKLSQ
ncbi:MAG: hypothetical protein RMN51_12995 [Verrucomicrobiota bacterium]|nr:hypothetical protein [Limisphaera sp.]MDW8383011.1 hypothetical protein [Verrucomicrobiota bacterium]